jgi:glutathione peroxidase
MKLHSMKLSVLIAAVLLSFTACAGNIYSFTMKDIDGKDVSLSSFKGKVLLFVNVASRCGNTPQYKDLQALYEKYKGKGLVVLGFPANNFMGQEPGSDKEIKQFCTTQYDVSFPMFSKISVKGGDMHPLYKFLTQKSENGVGDFPVKWNFQKFLVSRNGKLISSIAPGTSVDDQEVIKAIEEALK